MKTILVLNGSPRVRGNTVALVEAFARGAQEAGNQVHVCNLRELDIHPCMGCLQGGKNPDSPCIQKDDMDKIYRLYRQADRIVFASPMYFWSVSAQLKMVIDRLFAAMEGSTEGDVPAYQSNLTAKECMLIMPAEEDTEENFVPIQQYYEGYVARMGWVDTGRLLVGGLMQMRDHDKKPEAIQRAYEMGKAIR